jgi:hypothetical protein
VGSFHIAPTARREFTTFFLEYVGHKFNQREIDVGGMEISKMRGDE